MFQVSVERALKRRSRFKQCVDCHCHYRNCEPLSQIVMPGRTDADGPTGTQGCAEAAAAAVLTAIFVQGVSGCSYLACIAHFAMAYGPIDLRRQGQ